ncbi:MAG: DUF1343 domain-containing protein [Prevotellaceae bacterium]|jgi:uncharacterized protein YbbC (DUF1343 family)|nr:DUF1343 domain-containing protein [Prevotellaceae bacterium]
MKHFFTLLTLLIVSAAGAQPLQTGAERLDNYLPLLQGKRVGVTANHTAMIGEKHLVDVLLENNIKVTRIFAPEHGFRGTADAGEHFDTSVDRQTGIEVASLYGKNYKPAPEQLRDIDYMLFDIQDVGARFYTYLSTMHYVMEACAENNVPLIILDRPNPNGFYVDGPVLEEKFRSFVGMHPIPVVHGMTLGELARMINEEGWLANKIKCDLTVITCAGYSHKWAYHFTSPPSPNLPTLQAIHLYPSLCLFEGTVISVGRGTGIPFEVFGHPSFKPYYPFGFLPQSMPGAQNPPYKDEVCFGVNLHYYNDHYLTDEAQLRLEWLIEAYNHFAEKDKFFNNFFYKLCGTERIRRMVEQGLTADEIRASWQDEVNTFKISRKKYLLYEDFE